MNGCVSEQNELETLKAKFAKVEKERTDYKTAYDQLDSQVGLKLLQLYMIHLLLALWLLFEFFF